ncbi:hypothetical protein PAPYR_2240 [Paratrimastix pyriformis]|uniref:Swi5-dependent recombination DNA repair protein 1 homolog n=1 Tax=Paratrimastix pyriformis TaxID=342808 RepID=A0ABQ8UPY1_9EUKA|nr:hypothetical protein PAPYR_2240 [Paratrimastix pyriformis]
MIARGDLFSQTFHDVTLYWSKKWNDIHFACAPPPPVVAPIPTSQPPSTSTADVATPPQIPSEVPVNATTTPALPTSATDEPPKSVVKVSPPPAEPPRRGGRKKFVPPRRITPAAPAAPVAEAPTSPVVAPTATAAVAAEPTKRKPNLLHRTLLHQPKSPSGSGPLTKISRPHVEPTPQDQIEDLVHTIQGLKARLTQQQTELAKLKGGASSERMKELDDLCEKWRKACQEVSMRLLEKLRESVSQLKSSGATAWHDEPEEPRRPRGDDEGGEDVVEAADKDEQRPASYSFLEGPVTLGALLDSFGISRELVHYDEGSDSYE